MPPLPAPGSPPGGRRRTPEQRQGDWAEQRVLRLLQQRGWTVLARNWRCRWGEMDLLMAKPGRLLMVEVKGRRRCGSDGWGVGAFDHRKRRRLGRTLACWVAQNPAWQEVGVQLVWALVPLAPASGGVRWLSIDH